MRHFLLALPLLAAPALSVDEIDDLIEKGRSKLDLGDTAGALEFFRGDGFAAQAFGLPGDGGQGFEHPFCAGFPGDREEPGVDGRIG